MILSYKQTQVFFERRTAVRLNVEGGGIYEGCVFIMNMGCNDAALKDKVSFHVEPHRRVATKQTHGGFLRRTVFLRDARRCVSTWRVGDI